MFKIISFFIMRFDRIYMRVDILLPRLKHFRDHIISVRGDVWVPARFYWSACTKPGKRTVIYLCFRGINFVFFLQLLYWILELFWHCGIFLFFILLVSWTFIFLFFRIFFYYYFLHIFFKCNNVEKKIPSSHIEIRDRIIQTSSTIVYRIIKLGFNGYDRLPISILVTQ